MKIGFSTKIALIGAFLSLFITTPALSGLCSGGPWYNVLLFDVPYHSSMTCDQVVNSTKELNYGCNAIYPGSESINLGYCEPGVPPYEYSAYGDCQCPENQFPTCIETDLVIDSVAQPPISCPLLCSTECSIMDTTGEGQCLGNQWEAYACEQSGHQGLRCDCGAWTSTVPSIHHLKVHRKSNLKKK